MFVLVKLLVILLVFFEVIENILFLIIECIVCRINFLFRVCIVMELVVIF